MILPRIRHRNAPNAASPAETVEAADQAAPADAPRAGAGHPVIVEGLRAYYGKSEALKGIDIEFEANRVTAIIGPSGCGKSTLIRCLNRMHEVTPGAHAEGKVKLGEVDIYGAGVDVTTVRRMIGMVFQKAQPVSDDVDLRQRCGRAEARPACEERTSANGSIDRCEPSACGMRSRTALTLPVSDSPAASSSGCASPARSLSSPR